MSKPEIKANEIQKPAEEKEFYPLFMLKRELMGKMDFKDDHPYKIFVNWRFKDSVRRQEIFKKNLAKSRQEKLNSFSFHDMDSFKSKKANKNRAKPSKSILEDNFQCDAS